MPKHVFISYVRENQSIVDKLVQELEKENIEVWYDKTQLRGGDKWKDKIREAIRGGGFFIACFSKEAENKERSAQAEEIRDAIDELKKRHSDRPWFIPVKLNPCIIPERYIGGNEFLTDFHWIELYEDWNKGILDIVRAVTSNIIPINGHEIHNFFKISNIIGGGKKNRFLWRYREGNSTTISGFDSIKLEPSHLYHPFQLRKIKMHLYEHKQINIPLDNNTFKVKSQFVKLSSKYDDVGVRILGERNYESGGNLYEMYPGDKWVDNERKFKNWTNLDNLYFDLVEAPHGEVTNMTRTTGKRFSKCKDHKNIVLYIEYMEIKLPPHIIGEIEFTIGLDRK